MNLFEKTPGATRFISSLQSGENVNSYFRVQVDSEKKDEKRGRLFGSDRHGQNRATAGQNLEQR